MAKKWEVLPVLLITGFLGSAQGKIEPERPDLTESPDLVAKNIFQAEFGFNKENSSGRNYELLLPTALFKYGLKRIELRMEAVSRSSYGHPVPNTRRQFGIDPVSLGFKINIFRERKILPKTSLISSIGIPFLASRAYRADHVAPSIKLVMLNTFSDHADLSYNLGAEWDGFITSPFWLYTISQNFNLGDSWNTYIEVFGFLQKNQSPMHSVDAGIGYLISDNVKTDVSAGFGISSAAPKSYVSIGFSFRCNTRSRQ